MTLWRRLLGERDPLEDAAAPEPEDPGPSIGERLRERRTARGLSFADVERDIRINRLYLEALEDEDFQALPAPVYARGFMRSYARYLGLDPELAAREVPRDLPRPRGLEPLPGLRRAGAMTSVTLPAFTPSVRLVIVVATAVLLAVLGWFALQSDWRQQPGISIATATPADDAAPPAGTAAAAPVVPAATVPPFSPGTMPDFRGVDRDIAVALSESIQLVPLVVEEANAAPAGRVFDQSPAEGTPVGEGDVLTLFVSTGPDG